MNQWVSTRLPARDQAGDGVSNFGTLNSDWPKDKYRPSMRRMRVVGGMGMSFSTGSFRAWSKEGA